MRRAVLHLSNLISDEPLLQHHAVLKTGFVVLKFLVD